MSIKDSYAVNLLLDAEREEEDLRIAALDLDGTFCVTNPPTQEELNARETVNQILDERLAVRGYISYRTPGLMISSSACKASHAFGFKELPPKTGKDSSGKAVVVPTQDIAEFQHVHNPHFAVGIGSGMYFRQYPGNTFEVVKGFTDGIYGGVYWRSVVMWILEQIESSSDIPVMDHLADIEFASNYFDGWSNVYPLPFRIQLDFKGDAGLEMKLQISQLVMEFRNKVMADTTLVDPIVVAILEELIMLDESNPAKNKYTLYLLPDRFRKEYCVDFILNQLHLTVPCHFNKFKVLLSDDTLTGLSEAVYCRNVVNGTFILPGGSRLEPYFLDPAIDEFAGVPLEWIKPKMKRIVNRPGHYDVQTKAGHMLKFIIAAQAYPGTVGPASIQAFLEQEQW